MKKLGLIVTDLTRIETSEGLQRAIGDRLQRLMENARREWERHFVQKDPSDACVTVRIVAADTVVERKAIRGSGPVKSSRKRKQHSRLPLRRFAH